MKYALALLFVMSVGLVACRDGSPPTPVPQLGPGCTLTVTPGAAPPGGDLPPTMGTPTGYVATHYDSCPAIWDTTWVAPK